MNIVVLIIQTINVKRKMPKIAHPRFQSNATRRGRN